MANQLSKYEQEAIVNANAGEKLAEIYTADPAMIRKMDKKNYKIFIIQRTNRSTKLYNS